MKKLLLLFVIISFVLVVWIDFGLFPYLSCHKCNADKINSAISNISMSTIAAAIFYFIDIHLKEVNQKKKAKPYIISKLNAIVLHSDSLITNIEKKSGKKFSISPPPKQELLEATHSIALTSIYDANRVVQVKWEEYLKEVSADTRILIDRLQVFANQLDFDLQILLVSIHESPLFTVVNMVASVSTIQSSYQGNIPEYIFSGIDKLSIHHDHMLNYFQKIEELKLKISKMEGKQKTFRSLGQS